VLGHAKINESLNKKLLANDKTLESINIKIETLSSALKNQLSFNKMIKTQLAQIVVAVPAVDSRKILGQPEAPVENVSMVATRWDTHPGGHLTLTMQKDLCTKGRMRGEG
jgi:hypothetical protein